MMKIWVNGEPREVAQRLSIAALISSLGLEPRQVAVERNQELVPRRQHGETLLADGDQLEVVTLVGGG